MHWTGYIVFYGLPVLPLAYLVWRVTWAPQRSSKPGWVLIVTMAGLWAVACSPRVVFGPYKELLVALAYGEVFVGVLALELWSPSREESGMNTHRTRVS